MLELLDSHIIEIAITRTQVDNASYESIILPDEPLVLAMHKSFCDDDKSEFVHIQDLKDKPLLVPLRWKTAFMSHCQKAKFEPNILSVSDSQIQNMLWTQRGIGISLVPLSARSLMRSDDIVFKHLEEAEIYTHTVVSWLKSRTLSSSCQHFIEMFRQKYVK
jgi:DNA-binding transcriptional LysR family regulator